MTNQEMRYNLKAMLRMVLDNFTETTKDGMVVFSGDDDCRFASCMIQSVVKAIDRSDSMRRYLFKAGVEWPTVVDKTSNSVNLKLELMVLGNRLVADHGYTPIPESNRPGYTAGIGCTQAITDFTCWVNDNPEVRTVLDDLGYDWPVVETTTVEA